MAILDTIEAKMIQTPDTIFDFFFFFASVCWTL